MLTRRTPGMKTILLLSSALLAGMLGIARAQVEDDQASANLLEVQCVVSSGFSGADYGDYARKLAKTLAQLPPISQKRVFGYIPQPGVVAQSAPGSQNAPASGGTAVPSANDSSSGLLGNTLNAINGIIDGASEGAAPIIGGSAPAGDHESGTDSGSGAGTTTTGSGSEREETSGSSSSDWWGNLLSWFGSLFGDRDRDH